MQIIFNKSTTTKNLILKWNKKNSIKLQIHNGKCVNKVLTHKQDSHPNWISGALFLSPVVRKKKMLYNISVAMQMRHAINRWFLVPFQIINLLSTYFILFHFTLNFIDGLSSKLNDHYCYFDGHSNFPHLHLHFFLKRTHFLYKSLNAC